MSAATATLKRGAATRRKPRTTVKRPAGKARPSIVARAIAAIPVSHETIQRAVTGGILLFSAVVLIAIASMLGIPAYLGTQVAEAAGRAGFAVKRVDIVGLNHMDRLTVYAIALDQKSHAMPLVDLDQVRDRLMQYGWIEDARVSRRLPDTLVVDIVERTPTAVWQHNQKLTLIDAHGIELAPVKIDNMPDLPLVIGPDANVQATALTELMTNATRLKPLLASASWVGNRRWDLRFQSGEVLALPEGEAAAAKAVAIFDRLDDQRRLLGRGFARFDLRDGKNMVIRIDKSKPQIDRADAHDTDGETGGGTSASASHGKGGMA